MPISGDSTDTELDYFSPETNEKFDEVMAELLERRPLVNASGAWLLTRHEDVREAANDWKTFSSAGGTIPWSEDGAHFRPTAVDPPLHEQFRQPFLKVFAPRAVGPLEPMMREEARALIDSFRGAGRCDIGPDYARAYIARVFFKGILGLSPEVVPKMLRLIDGWLLPPFDDQALVDYNDYCSQILSEHLDSGSPRTMAMDALLTLEVDGEPASWEDKCNTLSLLIVGGLDTSATGITQSLRYLATHPDLLAELVDDPSLIPAAVEEFIRRFPPNIGNGRRVTRPVELHGQQLKPGDRVMLGYGPASQDPRVFDDPLTVDIHRQSQGHLGFGAGIHRCLGSHFARLEIRVAVEEFIAAFPQFRLAPDAEVHYHTGMTREVSGVRVELG
ncbi:cytochrome P450 [Nocardioides immobilis]|nr:cytochrome P450 [Nocardioides immobilis]